MDMGKLDARHKLTVVRKLCGQLSGEPNGVLDQSLERMSLPISPPPDKNSGTEESSVWGRFELFMVAKASKITNCK